MKKNHFLLVAAIGITSGIVLGVLGFFTGRSYHAAAGTDEKEVNFSNGVTAYVNIEDAGTDKWRLVTTVDGGTTSNMRCDLMTPDSVLHSISACNGTFSYDGNRVGRIKLWIRYNEVAPTDREDKPSSDSEWTYPQWVYDFDSAERYNDSYYSTSNGDLDNFYVTADDTTPSTSQYVDLTVKARDNDNSVITDYTDTINFKIYYRTSSSSSWVQTTSSTYYTMGSSYTDGYDFTSSDDGVAELTNFIKFKKNNYDYKVRVYAENDTSIYKEITFYVGSSSSSNVEGFSSSELNTVQAMYDSRDDMIDQLEDQSSALRNSSRRQTMSDDLKTAMEEIIDDDINKTYDNFDDFYSAWLDRYRYTNSIK